MTQRLMPPPRPTPPPPGHMPYAGQWRACWINEQNETVLGELNTFHIFAYTEMLGKKMLGFSAWVQDDENNITDK
jgi:hypothetical protein